MVTSSRHGLSVGLFTVHEKSRWPIAKRRREAGKTGVGGCGFVVGRATKLVHRSPRRICYSRARICSSFFVKSRSKSIHIPTRSFVGMTESILFGIITRCHPELVSGSGFWRKRGWGLRVRGRKEQEKPVLRLMVLCSPRRAVKQ